MICDNFRANVKAILSRKKWTRSQLAKELDCSPAYISQMLSGRRDPGLAVVEKFAEALSVSPTRLIKKPSFRG